MMRITSQLSKYKIINKGSVRTKQFNLQTSKRHRKLFAMELVFKVNSVDPVTAESDPEKPTWYLKEELSVKMY